MDLDIWDIIIFALLFSVFIVLIYGIVSLLKDSFLNGLYEREKTKKYYLQDQQMTNTKRILEYDKYIARTKHDEVKTIYTYPLLRRAHWISYARVYSGALCVVFLYILIRRYGDKYVTFIRPFMVNNLLLIIGVSLPFVVTYLVTVFINTNSTTEEKITFCGVIGLEECHDCVFR